MNLYEIIFKGDKSRYLFESEMDLGSIAMILNGNIKFLKIGDKVIGIEEVVTVEISNIKTVNEEMYNRMKPDIPVIEFPIYEPTMVVPKEYADAVFMRNVLDDTIESMDKVVNNEIADIEATTKRIDEQVMMEKIMRGAMA